METSSAALGTASYLLFQISQTANLPSANRSSEHFHDDDGLPHPDDLLVLQILLANLPSINKSVVGLRKVPQDRYARVRQTKFRMSPAHRLVDQGPAGRLVVIIRARVESAHHRPPDAQLKAPTDIGTFQYGKQVAPHETPCFGTNASLLVVPSPQHSCRGPLQRDESRGSSPRPRDSHR